MASKDGTIPPSGSEAPSRAARRRLITRALLGQLPEYDGPDRTLFHFEREMAEQFAKNRLSSYAVIPVLIVIMGLAIAFLGDPYTAAGWVVLMLAVHAYAIRASRRFLREALAHATLYVWKQRFIQRDLLCGFAWATFPLLL